MLYLFCISGEREGIWFYAAIVLRFICVSSGGLFLAVCFSPFVQRACRTDFYLNAGASF